MPILFAVFTPVTLGFLFMAIVGMKQLTYFGRLRKLLRAANDWTCDLPSLARKAQIKQETAYDTVTKAVGQRRPAQCRHFRRLQHALPGRFAHADGR